MKNLSIFLGLAIAVFVTAQMAQATQVINDTLQVNSLKVGQQGIGGVTYFNGTIINETTTDGADNPVVFGDSVRIDGQVYRGATPGTSDYYTPFKINDNVEITGTLKVGGQQITASTDYSSQINTLNSNYSSLAEDISDIVFVNDAQDEQIILNRDYIRLNYSFLECVMTISQYTTYLESVDFGWCWNQWISGIENHQP